MTGQNATLAATTLKSKDGKEISGKDLWTESPVLVVCLRRPGCLLCREEAVTIWSERSKFEEAGVKLVCILHEWKDREVEAFSPKFWGGELYYDAAKNFHAAVHGGKVKKGNIIDLLNPFSRAWKNMRRAKDSGKVTDSNLVGDGLTLGGVMVIKKGGEIVYSFPESTFGDHAPFDELLKAAQDAAK